ncbi:MFS transporter [Neobacillus niacini]|uniref:MFS transporter n=1 Tax=Neobacillus niacini TaxID=86668 RepID=UPI002FFEF562
MQTAKVQQNQSATNLLEDKKLTFREKVALGLGGMTGTIHSQMIALFLLFFYTDVMEISPAYVAGLFLAARIVSAAAGPVFGIYVDKVTTPWGKYVPWFIILGVPSAILGWLTFTDFNLGPDGKIIYATVTYILYSILLGAIQAPGTAVGPAITKRVDDRVSIGQISYFVVVIGAMIVSVAGQPLYKAFGGGNDAKGFSMLMGIIAVLCVMISVFQVSSLKERYVVQNKKDEKKLSLKEMSKAVFTNKAAVIIYIYVFAMNLAPGIRNAISLHYYKYYFHNENIMAIMGLVAIVPTFIGVTFSAKITKRFGLKANVLIGSIVSVVTAIMIPFFPSTSTGAVLYIASAAIGSLFQGFAAPAQAAMLPAAMDYTEWKTGINVNAFMGSIQGVMKNVAVAISGSLAAGALVFIGYLPGVEQSSETIFGLKMLMGVLPAIILVFTAAVAWFDITEEKQAQIAKDLAERRKAGQQS